MIKKTAVSFGCLILLLALVCCDLTEQKYYEIMKLETAEEQSDSVSVINYSNEEIIRSMYADKVERYIEKKKTISYNVTLTDYHNDGSVKMNLVADTLVVDEVLNSYTAKGNVVVKSDEGILLTQHLIWNQNNDEIYSPVNSTVIRGRNVIRGFELTTNSEFTKVEMKRVTAEGVIDEDTFDW